MEFVQFLAFLEHVGPLVASAVALITGVWALLSKRKEIKVNVADKAVEIAGGMMDRLQGRVDELESEVKGLKVLNISLNEQVQILTKKVNYYEQERIQWLEGAKKLECQVVELGEVPVWHPPEEA